MQGTIAVQPATVSKKETGESKAESVKATTQTPSTKRNAKKPVPKILPKKKVFIDEEEIINSPEQKSDSVEITTTKDNTLSKNLEDLDKIEKADRNKGSGIGPGASPKK